MERLDDAGLLVRTGVEAAAFGVFYRRHERGVLQFFLYVGVSAEVAADLTAETFAEALLSRERFRSELGEPRAWLFGIARHLLARSRERGRVDARARVRLGIPRLELDDEAIGRIDAVVGQPHRALELLDGLPVEQRAAVEARVLEEREYAEIAASLACSEQVVRKRVSRALASLRERLEESS